MKKRKWMILSWMILFVGMVTLAFGVPSPALLGEAEEEYMDSFFEEDLFEDWEEENISTSGIGYGSSNDSAGSLAFEEGVISILPFDFSAGMVPKEENYTENTYKDSTISVTMKTEKIEDTVYHTAHVKIAHPAQLRTALAAPFGAKKTNKVSTMAKENNAIVAINGDYYIQRSGYIVRQSEVYRTKVLKDLDNLLIDENGDFHLIKGGDTKGMKELTESGIKIINSFTFGPAMIIDGEIQEKPKEYRFNIKRNEPRAALGQIGPLEYLFVVADGRSDASKGVSTDTLGEYMHGLGCQQAFNLDGGNSATLIFHNDYYSTKSEKAERSISDIIYFATAEN
ncbi:MAG: phosphodiester glycosidase family protein [Clostridiales bacterium]|nr:phosphodiester glycosidase family protein [Clostridiales bacterium]